MESISRFNKFVALLFGRLYTEFPEPLRIEPDEFFKEMFDVLDEDGASAFPYYFRSTVRWLEKAGYIWITVDFSSTRGPSFEVVLSEKGLEALRKVPESLEGIASIGERLVEFSKNKASGAISTLISLAITSATQS